MTDPEQQRRMSDFSRKVKRRLNLFYGSFFIFIVMMGLYYFLARPALEQSGSQTAHTLVAAGDTLSAVVMIGIFLTIAFLLVTGRLRVLLQPGDQVTFVMPAERDANLPAGPQSGPSQQTLLVSWLLFYGGILVGGILLLWLEQLVERTWPALPVMIPRMGVIVPALMWVALLTLGRDWIARGSDTTPGQFRRHAIARLRGFALAAGLFILVMLGLGLAAEGYLPGDLTGIVRGVARWVERNLFFALLALGGVGFALYIFALWLVEAELKRGHYDRALGLTKRLGFLMGAPESRLFFQGSVLLFAGRNAEAERLLDESIRRGTTPDHAAFALENRGYARLRQGQYALAQADFEAAIRARPEGHGAYSGLAETLLWARQDMRRAVELSEQALTNLELLASARRFSGERRGEYWSVKAWALAETGIQADADRALETAFQLARQDYVPVLALIHCRAARVYALRGDQTRAQEMLRQAVRLDPEGYAGQLASRMLRGDMQEAG